MEAVSSLSTGNHPFPRCDYPATTHHRDATKGHARRRLPSFNMSVDTFPPAYRYPYSPAPFKRIRATPRRHGHWVRSPQGSFGKVSRITSDPSPRLSTPLLTDSADIMFADLLPDCRRTIYGACHTRRLIHESHVARKSPLRGQ
jgi:hypothetical protein